MYKALFIVIVIGFLNTFETVYFYINGETKFGNSLWIIWSIWGVSLATLIAFYYRRRYLQRKYSAIANDQTIDETYIDADYYYQLPIVKIVDKMSIMIFGRKNMRFELYFNNGWQKFLTIYDIVHIAGVNLSSNENNVLIKPIKPIRHLNRYMYDIYFNDQFYGTLRSKKALKEKGFEKYLHFAFESEQEKLNVENEYLSLDLTMKNNLDEKVVYAKRNFFSFEKDKHTNKRGEKHEVNIFHTSIPDEILLAIYIQMMNIKNH